MAISKLATFSFGVEKLHPASGLLPGLLHFEFHKPQKSHLKGPGGPLHRLPKPTMQLEHRVAVLAQQVIHPDDLIAGAFMFLQVITQPVMSIVGEFDLLKWFLGGFLERLFGNSNFWNFWDPGSEMPEKARNPLDREITENGTCGGLCLLRLANVWNSFRKPSRLASVRNSFRKPSKSRNVRRARSHSRLCVVWTFKKLHVQIDCKQVVALTSLLTIPDYNSPGMASVISNQFM